MSRPFVQCDGCTQMVRQDEIAVIRGQYSDNDFWLCAACADGLEDFEEERRLERSATADGSASAVA